MSERKLDEIENMFKKTTKPKLEITEILELKKIGVILDSKPQGNIAFKIAAKLAESFKISLDVIISDSFHDSYQSLNNNTNSSLDSLKNLVNENIEASGVYAKVHTVLNKKIEDTLKIFNEEIDDDQKLGNRLVSKLEEIECDLIVVGVPLFRDVGTEDAENLGTYVSKLLRARRIHSNFLLVSDKSKEITDDTLLGFVSIEQQPTSIVALTKRALGISNEKTKIHLVGMIEDKVIETVARVDLLDTEEDETESAPDLKKATLKLETKMNNNLEAISIEEGITYGSFTTSVETGSISSIVTISIDKVSPGLILVRSVAEIAENLDPIAEQITRMTIRAGIPCLLIWD